MRRFLFTTIVVISFVAIGVYYYLNTQETPNISTDPTVTIGLPSQEDGRPHISSFSLEIEHGEQLIDVSVLGEVYFILASFDGEQSHTYNLVSLPGLCVVGKMDCPAPQVIDTPFDPKNTPGLDWSPDGELGLALELNNEETDWGMRQVPPSRMYVYDPLADSWTKIFESNEYIIGRGMNSLWSPDGRWIAFTLRTVDETGKSDSEALYVIHPDGAGMKQVFSPAVPRFSWAGDQLLLQTYQDLNDPESDVIIYTIDPETKTAGVVFKPDRFASLHPSHGGAMLVYADQQDQRDPTPTKEVRLFDLSGTLMHVLGSYSNMYTGIFPVLWSSDDSFLAFGNFGRMYVSKPYGDPVEVYKADDSHVQPGIWNATFSPDSKYLLMEVYDGNTKLVAVSVDGKSRNTVTWPGMGDLDQPAYPSWLFLP